jgi:NADH-quinone oxidoreductase E subunit
MLSDEAVGSIQALGRKYPDPRSAVLPALYLAQEEHGWLSREALEDVSRALDMPRALVRGVASFYGLYRHQPCGRHIIRLCTNVSCMMQGAEDVLKFLADGYGLKPGCTRADGRFTLYQVECMGGCGSPPSMLVDGDLYHGVRVPDVPSILERYN